MSRMTTKDRKAQRREAFRLTLLDDHLIAIGQVALRGGMLDNLIELTAEQLIRRHSPIVRKELSKFTTAKKIDLIKEALTQDMPESSNAIAEFFAELYSARPERNEIVHRTWRATDTPGSQSVGQSEAQRAGRARTQRHGQRDDRLPNRLLILRSNLATGKWPLTMLSSAGRHHLRACPHRSSGR